MLHSTWELGQVLNHWLYFNCKTIIIFWSFQSMSNLPLAEPPDIKNPAKMVPTGFVFIVRTLVVFHGYSTFLLLLHGYNLGLLVLRGCRLIFLSISAKTINLVFSWGHAWVWTDIMWTHSHYSNIFKPQWYSFNKN